MFSPVNRKHLRQAAKTGGTQTQHLQALPTHGLVSTEQMATSYLPVEGAGGSHACDGTTYPLNAWYSLGLAYLDFLLISVSFSD